MKTNPDNMPTPSDPNSPSTGVLETLAKHRRRLRWLTGAAVAFWALAVLGSVSVVVAYSLFIVPKEQNMLARIGSRMIPNEQTAETPGHADSGTPNTAQEARDSLVLSFVTLKGVLIVAMSLVVLSCGTLATLILVVFNRRVTLRQINYSLAQISEQLKQLQDGKGAA